MSSNLCDICNRTFISRASLYSHRYKYHKKSDATLRNSKSTPINLKIHQPYEEMSNEEIASRYLNSQKDQLDEATHKKLKLKLKGLSQFIPKPDERKLTQSSDDETPTINKIPKPSTTKRKRNSDDEDKPTPKARRSATAKNNKRKCPVCQNKFDTKHALSLHVNEHPKCIYCGKRYKDYKTFLRHLKTKHRRLNAIQAIINGAEELKDDDDTEDSNPESALESEGDESDITVAKIDEKSDSEDADLDEDIPNPTPKKVQCRICLKNFKTQTELFKYMSILHPKCPLCDNQFIDGSFYLKHRKNSHQSEDVESEGKTSLSESSLESEATDLEDDGSQLDSEGSESDEDGSIVDKAKNGNSEPDSDDPNTAESMNDNDEDADDESDSVDEMKRLDKLHKKHINCVTVGRFVQVRNLIRNDDFDELAQDANLVKALRVIIKGVLEGFIPICSAQRMVLTPELKMLMHDFNKYPDPQMILEQKQNLKMLFEILGKSVKVVIDAFIKYEL